MGQLDAKECWNTFLQAQYLQQGKYFMSKQIFYEYIWRYFIILLTIKRSTGKATCTVLPKKNSHLYTSFSQRWKWIMVTPYGFRYLTENLVVQNACMHMTYSNIHIWWFKKVQKSTLWLALFFWIPQLWSVCSMEMVIHQFSRIYRGPIYC
jgi:hypothetical protein